MAMVAEQVVSWCQAVRPTRQSSSAIRCPTQRVATKLRAQGRAHAAARRVPPMRHCRPIAPRAMAAPPTPAKPRAMDCGHALEFDTQ